jgi:6-phosphofructokinase 1
MMTAISRISINTGGGDAPGLNAVIHSVVYAASRLGWKVFGIREGFDGILYPDRYADGGVIELTRDSVENIAHLGGTILGTTNRGNPFRVAERRAGGVEQEVDRSAAVIASMKRRGLDAHVAVGGDGSLTIALELYRKGLRVVGVPKTIDNDLDATATTFGFSTAVSFATECIDRLRVTAQAHRRIIVVEVMGRSAGWIALHAGIAGRVDAILIPEIPYDIQEVARHIRAKTDGGREHALVVVAEAARPVGGEATMRTHGHGAARFGGIGETLAEQLQELTGQESRAVSLGHLVRGGTPNATDRILGMSFGAAAVHALSEGQNGIMVALNPPRIDYVPLEQAVHRIRTVPPDGEMVLVARALDINLGDSAAR